MKPLQIGVLVLVGAVAGAVVMRVVQRPHPAPIVELPVAEPAPAVAPAPAPVAAPKPAPAPQPPKPRKATAFPLVAHRAKPAPAVATPTKPAVTMIAQSRPAVVAPPQPAPEQEAPEPVVPMKPEPQPAPAPAPVEPMETPPTVILRAGMLLPVRLGEGLSSEHNRSGDTFTATLDAPLVADGFVIAERGARLEGRVVEAGKTSALVIELTRLHTSDGQRIPLQTETFRKQTSSSTARDVGLVAGGAALGAAIGAAAGGGRGAGIGAAVGGVAGAGGAAATRRGSVLLPAETKLSFRLREAITITEQLNR